MIQLQSETNIDIMRQYALCLEGAYADLFKKYKILKEQLDRSDQQNLIPKLEDQLNRLKVKFFGFGREELKKKLDRPIDPRQEELKLHNERTQSESAHSRRKKGELDSHELPESVYYLMQEEDLRMESEVRGIKVGHDSWQQIKNLFQESVEITVTERIYKKVVHKQAKYRLKDEYNTSGKEVIVTAPGPAKLKPGCTYSIDFALAVVSDKYEFHLPLERQRRKMESAGLDVNVKSLYSLCQAVAEHCELSVVPKIKRDLFNEFCAIHLDESPWPIHSSDQTSYMWAASNRIGSYYRFEPTRSGKVALEVLDGYQGAILTDGFSGYNRIKGHPDYRVGHCWAHARREFYERWEDYPKETERIIGLIDQLFKVEAEAKTFAQLGELRKKESKRITDELYSVLLETKSRFLPSEGIVSAINYCLRFWKELTLFLKDLSLDLSNNDAERALRHIVMGRKNFGGSKTFNGADVAATLYTVIETAKKVGLQPKEYLKYVITERWHGRDPKSPLERSIEVLGQNQEVTFPKKNEWEIT